MVDSVAGRHASFDGRFASLLRHPICHALREILRQRPGHLVGGALRDTALGRQFRDLDVIVAGGGADTADHLATRLGSRSIKVGGQRFGAYRVLWRGSPIDIWDRGSVGLDADLLRRDFTIHSFAVDLRTGAVRDPISGLDDLAAGQLRMTSPETFADDPLRVLRLCRFAAQLVGFRVDAATRDQAHRSVADLVGVATERLRSEIEQTLAQTGAAAAVELWIDLQVFPDALLQSSLEYPSRLNLQAELSGPWKALELTGGDLPITCDLSSARLALLLHQLGTAAGLECSAVLESLRLRGLVTKAKCGHVARLLEVGRLPSAESEQRWYLHRAGNLWPAAISLSAALAHPKEARDQGTARRRQAVALATERSEEIFDPPPLISGDDLQRHLTLPPGPELGQILGILRRRQIEGSITTRDAALAAAARLHSVNGRE